MSKRDESIMFDYKIKNSWHDFRQEIPSNITFSKSDNSIIFFENSSGSIEIEVQKDLDLDLTILFLPSTSNTKKIIKVNFSVESNSKIKLKIANLANYDCDDEILIDLKGENSSIEFYNAAILNKDVQKNSIIKSVHNARNTTSNVKTYEVLKDESKGFIRCISDLKKGSANAEAHQELRLLVLDKNAKADSDPILLIDENDIVASHANAIGMLDQDQMFYLLSRGLTEVQSQELIINGYFEPIFQEIEDNDLNIYLKEKLKEMI